PGRTMVACRDVPPFAPAASKASSWPATGSAPTGSSPTPRLRAAARPALPRSNRWTGSPAWWHERRVLEGSRGSRGRVAGPGGDLRGCPATPARARLPDARRHGGRRGHRAGSLVALAGGRPRQYRAAGCLADDRHDPPGPRPPAFRPAATRTLRGPLAAGAHP